MNLDHIKSDSLRNLDLGQIPVANLEDLNEYGFPNVANLPVSTRLPKEVLTFCIPHNCTLSVY